MAASDDPLFLRLTGPLGREFRLQFAKGKGLRRGQEDRYVLGSPDDRETNVAHPELNDPSVPALRLAGIDAVQLVKGLEPLPNVRGIGEMDDRLLIDEAEVIVHATDATRVYFRRSGPLWLGLVCGLCIDLSRIEGES